MKTPLLVIGLGNPGEKYATTRHNLGAIAAQALIDEAGSSWQKHKKTNTLVAELPGMVVATLRSYMNLSGTPTAALARYFRIPPERIVIMHDELEIELGEVQVRPGGGDRGHNGLRSITQALGTKDYVRLSLGIGRPPGRMDPAAYVLKPFNKKEREELPFICDKSAQALESLR